MPTTQEYLKEVSVIMEGASKAGVTLRLLGSIAFKKHCPKYGSMIEKMNRTITDIDLVGYGSQQDEIVKLFSNNGYSYDAATYAETALMKRLIFWKKDRTEIHVDVFLDTLQMCHTIEFKNRLEVERETIPLAEMFLEKLQIVKLAEKDVKDIIVLLLEHDLGDSDDEMININYISKLLSKDWGFHYTVTQNLQKLLNHLDLFDILAEDQKESTKKKIHDALELIEEAPKSMGWKLRARMGTKFKWYQEVEVAERQTI